jgi:hypothetical protein
MPGLLDDLVPRAKKPEPVDVDFWNLDHTTQCVIWGAQYERDEVRKAEEASLCRELYALLEERYAEYLAKKDALTDSSLRQYTISCKAFLKWCEEAGLTSMDTRKERAASPLSVAGFLNDELTAGAKPALIRRHSAAISWLHRNAGLPDPTTDPLCKAIVLASTQGHRDVAADEH